MGINFTFDSPCWQLMVFDSAAERDAWLSDNQYNDQGNLVAEAETASNAAKLIGSAAYRDLCNGDYRSLQQESSRVIFVQDGKSYPVGDMEAIK
jgi:hypothetical protein